MSGLQTFTVPPEPSRTRADKALALAHPEQSRAAWQRAFEAGLVRLGDRVLSQNDTVKAGEVISFALPETKPSELKPADIDLDVLFEDEHLLALNKAAGMVVHPGAGTGDDTLVHALLGHCAGSLSGVGGVERPGIVHRLDRETTGVILVAKNDAAHRGLSEQFAARQLHKEYLALVTGVPRLLSGVIEAPIERHPTHRQRMTTGEGGRSARTDWKVEESFAPHATLLRCHIHTGRTHQIRVHMKFIGHILLGDAHYGWKAAAKLPVKPTRVMLHADHIKFLHPVTGRAMHLQAPLPKDFQKVLKALRAAKK
jgi:23S rRNA pseudouridine1911/1915/1917 synthase